MYKCKNKNLSLAKSLGRLVSLTVTLIFFIVIFSICMISYHIQMKERRDNLQTVGSTISKLIERPISLGDFALVESYLTVNNLPSFVEHVSVKENNGQLIAGQNFLTHLKKSECNFSETFSIPIGNTSLLMSSSPMLTIKAQYCDIRDNAIKLGVGAIILAIILSIIISIVGQWAV